MYVSGKKFTKSGLRHLPKNLTGPAHGLSLIRLA